MRLERTSFACPEQYNVWHGKHLVGYLRLCHGHFTVSYPDVDGDIIYEDYPEGDGMFTDSERKFYLDKAIQAISNKLKLKSRIMFLD